MGIQAIFTGSTTVVDGKPKFVYPGLCSKGDQSWPDCHTGTGLAIAVPANESDPLYTKWMKTGVIMNNTQRDPSTAWQDPTTMEWRLTTFGGTVYGSMDFKTWYPSNGTSGFHAGECPSFFPLPRTTPHAFRGATAAASLHRSHAEATPTFVNKYSDGPDQMAWGDYVSGAVGASGKFTAAGTMVIDAGGHYYASKDMYDPIKNRRINWGWARSVGAGCGVDAHATAGLGFGPGSAQTLVRMQIRLRHNQCFLM